MPALKLTSHILLEARTEVLLLGSPRRSLLIVFLNSSTINFQSAKVILIGRKCHNVLLLFIFPTLWDSQKSYFFLNNHQPNLSHE